MGCDILTNESCSNQLSILSELRSFREFLKQFNYDDIIHDLENKIINEKTFIYGDPTPEDNFKTLKGVQDYVLELEERVTNWIDTIAGENGEIDWNSIIDGSDNPSQNHDIIKNSTSVIDALVKINNYLNTLTDTGVFDIKINGESVTQQDEHGLLFANIPLISQASATIGTNNSEEEASVSVNTTEEENIQKLNFTFNNIKGRKGDTGATGPVGPQGDSAVYDPSSPDAPDFVMANTTGNSTTKAMTQKAITDELEDIDLWEEIQYDYSTNLRQFWGIGDYTKANYNENIYNYYASPSKYGGIYVPINGGEEFKIVKGDVAQYRIEFLAESEFPPLIAEQGNTPLWAGDGTPIGVKTEEERFYKAPDNAKYMYVQQRINSANVAPTIYLLKRKSDYKKKIDSPDTSTFKVLKGWALFNDDQNKQGLYPREDFFITDFIPCKAGDVLSVFYGSNVSYVSCVHFFNNKRGYISFVGANSDSRTGQYSTIIANENVAFFRLCYRGSGFASINGKIVFRSDQVDESAEDRDAAMLAGQSYEQEFTATGAGTTIVNINFGHLKPGARYRLVIDDTAPWEEGSTVATQKNIKFAVYPVGTSNYNYYAGLQAAIPSILDFVAYENTEYTLAFRSTAGTEVRCKLIRPIGDVVESLIEFGENSENFTEASEDFRLLNLKENVWNNATFIPDYQEVIPNVSDVLNSVRHTSYKPDDNYYAYNGGTSPDKNYLSWFPKVWIAGGGVLTLNLTGVRGVSISEWPWRELNVGLRSTGYGNTDLIKQTSITAAIAQVTEGIVTLKLQPETRRIVITFNYGEACTPSQITESITSAILPVASFERWTFKSKDDEEVVEDVKENAYGLLSLVKEAHWVRSKDPTPNPVLGLLHYSDIHTSDIVVPQIKLAKIKYENYIDDVLSTGDSVLATAIYPNSPSENASKGLQWWLNSGLAPYSLYSVGNHDVNIQNNPDMTREECFDYYFAPFIDGWGVTPPTGWDDPESIHYKATYWHKDYTAQKIRLINIDAISHFDGILDPATGEILEVGVDYTSNSQELWLIEKLNETLPGSGNAAEGFSVVISSHYPLDDCGAENSEWDDSIHKWIGNQSANGGIVVKQDGCIKSNWHCQYNNNFVADDAFNMRNGRYKGKVNNIGNILEYWMGGYVPAVDTANKNPNELGWYEKTTVNGKYAYVLTEDTSVSNSKLYYIKSDVEGADFIVWLCGHTHKDMFFYPSRYPNILNIGAQLAGNQRDQFYMSRGDVALTANLVFISNSYGLIKIIRIGNSSNLYLRPTTYLCYDYKNRKVISEG